MPEKPTQPPAAEKPIPPRFWWLKRILVGVVILFVALGGLRWWWGVHADRAFRAEVDRYRAAGQPIRLNEFNTPPVPDDQNAALLLKKAVAAFKLEGVDQQLVMDVISTPGEITRQRDGVQRVLDATRESRALVRRARSLPQADWAFSPAGWRNGAMVSWFPDAHALGNLLTAAAMQAHADGNDAEAVATLRDMLAFGRHVGATPPLLPTLLHGVISGCASAVVLDIASTLQVGKDAANSAVTPADRRNAEALLAELLDDKPLRDGLVRGYCFGRARQAEDIETAATDTADMWLVRFRFLALSRAAGALLRPMIRLDGPRVLRYDTALVNTAAAPTVPEARRRSPAPPGRVRLTGLRGMSRAMSESMLASLSGTVEVFLRFISHRRTAAVALAARLYELDHGQAPSSADLLVPRYLAAIPDDPVAGDGRKIQYPPPPKEKSQPVASRPKAVVHKAKVVEDQADTHKRQPAEHKP